MNDKELERFLKSVENKRRLQIIKILKSKGKLPVGEIAKELKLSFKATSRHLNTLFSTGALEREQIVLNMLYELPTKRHKLLLDLIASL